MSFILSLDQATKITGYSVFESNECEEDYKLISHGIIKVNNKDFELNAFEMWSEINKLINKYEIDLVLLENIQLQTNPSTFKKLSIILGGAMEVCGMNQVNYLIISPTEWRKILGNTSKKKRKELKKMAQTFVENKYGLTVSEDEADSISMASYYFDKYLGGK